MLSKGAKRTIFYHITEILQYCLDKTIARSGDMYRDDLGILTFVIKCFGITNTSVQNFAIRISSVKTVPKCLETKSFSNKFSINVSSLFKSSLRAIVICQKYFGNHVISSEIHLFAPLLNMRRCTLCFSTSCLNYLFPNVFSLVKTGKSLIMTLSSYVRSDNSISQQHSDDTFTCNFNFWFRKKNSRNLT